MKEVLSARTAEDDSERMKEVVVMNSTHCRR